MCKETIRKYQNGKHNLFFEKKKILCDEKFRLDRTGARLLWSTLMYPNYPYYLIAVSDGSDRNLAVGDDS